MKLVAIGYLGDQTVYVNISKQEAIDRYDRENPDFTVIKNNLRVKEIDVDEKFYVYDIWKDTQCEIL